MRLEAVGQRSETVRRSNLSAIVRGLHEGGPASRSELVARTGLTRSAIRGLIGELAASDLVAEERADSQGMPGRPSRVVRIDPDGAVVLALEIAVDSLAAAIVGLGGEVFERVRVDRPAGHTGVDGIAADLAELASALQARRPAAEAPVGVGVAIVGVVRRSDGVVALAPNLGWRDVPLGDALAAALDVAAPISVANDADLGALVEFRRGAAVGGRDVLFISGEYGVGGGLIVDGRPLTGVAGYGGEVGHMPVNPTGAACRCGSIGCWETEVGEGALLRMAGRPPGGGRPEVDALVRDAEAGVPAAMSALDHGGRWLGIGLAGLVNIFNPGIIVLGGIFGRILPLVGPTIERELDRRALAAPRRLVRIVPAVLGEDAPLLGAAELAFEPLLADPAGWLVPRRARTTLATA
ncbi:MAG: ROK family protein [Chloroflexota bacterium]